MRPKTILQHDMRDCGAACLSTLSKYYNIDLPLSQSRILCKTDLIGSNLYGIVDAAKKVGFHAEALNGTANELLDNIQNKKICFPFIAHIINENQFLHYVVVFSLRNNYLIIGDPSKGTIRMDLDSFFKIWTGYMINVSPVEKILHNPKGEDKQYNFFSLLNGQWSRMIIITLLSLLIAGIGIAGSFIFQIVLDNFGIKEGYYNVSLDDDCSHEDISEHNIEFNEEEHAESKSQFEKVLDILVTSNLLILCVSIAGLYLLQIGIQLIRGKLILKISKTIDLRLTLKYYCHLQDTQIELIRNMQTGEYLSRLSDATIIRDAISTILVTFLLDFVMVIASGFILFNINRDMFFISFFVMCLYAILVIAYKKPLELSNRKVMQKSAEIHSYFKETLDGIETIRATSSTGIIKETATTKFTSFVDASVKNAFLSITQESVATALEMIGTIFILGLGFSFVGYGTLSVGGIMTFYALLSYFTLPIKNLIELQPNIQKAKIAAERLRDVLDLPCEEESTESSSLNNISKCEIENVSFRYGNRPLLLKDISLKINQGEKIALVGESGCGKTTLAKLILRFYIPEKGTIRINGENIENYKFDDVRKRITYVSQDTFLFSNTVRYNLTLGLTDIGEKEIIEVCNLCNLNEWISSLPFGLETPLEEDGSNLSAGQKQRIAIARALLRKPDLLILDEATSNLDTITEKAVQSAIENSFSTMSCIIIAHRLNTVKKCDRIYVMDHGQIVEQGTHDELTKGNRLYASFWSL